MQKLIKAVRLSLIYGAALLFAGSYPLSAMAEAVDTSSTSTATAPAEITPADPASISSPLVASATPTADTTSPAPSDTVAPSSDTPTQPKETYTYNPDTEHWDSNIWRYNPTTGMYERIPQTTETPQPSLLTAPSSLISPATGTSGQAVSQPSSTTISDTTKSALTNAINSGALTGDATVKNNTQAGSATTGDASAATTIINNVNSTVTNTSNQKAATFVSDVMGDVSGDILLQPTLLKAMLEAGAQTPSANNTTVTTTNQLTNNVTLDATSGDATVTGNTKAGNATTGDAATVANILNIVNSMVSANQSFVGTINIYGNLDGDILIAPDFIPQMLANNGTTSTPTSSQATVSSQDTQSIVNNIALAAQTGSAAVTDNTTAGSATTGDAMTNIVLFNLTGHDIIASNSLLVFVNVLGKWVGVIVDAPVGATAAAIGNGVSTDTTISPDLIINAKTDTQITNNVTLTSQSGNALVSDNTLAGNATTGNASASANIGNIVGTQMGLSGWFGILFINVFGTWNGSFGIDTAAGNHVAATGGGAAAVAEQKNGQPMRVIEFIPHTSARPSTTSTSSVTLVGSNGNGGYAATNGGDQPTVNLASATRGGVIENPDTYAVSQTLEPVGLHPALYIPWLAGATFLLGISLVGASTLSDMRRRGTGPK